MTAVVVSEVASPLSPTLTQALGTMGGAVHLLDHNGHVKRTIRSHRLRVNDVSVDLSGDFVASCSDDGTVVVGA